jgi:hypothetical protein
MLTIRLIPHMATCTLKSAFVFRAGEEFSQLYLTSAEM